MENILTMEHISKRYGRHLVVNDVSLRMKQGHIYGLIGPNGAGKTTIMKMIAGLTLADQGEITLFGEKENLAQMRKRMSFMIEAPYLDGGATAWQNMKYISYVRGVEQDERIREVLDFVGLADTAGKLVREFSLGMKQRLGIGMALLSKPEFMVLDEPVNGLDPEGIIEIRKMLKNLSEKQGISILISSHLLSELSELCTDFFLMNHGRIVETLSKEDLSSRCDTYLAVQTQDAEKAAKILEAQKIPVRLVLQERSLEEFYMSAINAENQKREDERV